MAITKMKTTISKKAVRELVKSLFESTSATTPTTPTTSSSSLQDDSNPIEPNDVIDPLESITNPDNKDFKPRNKSELQVAIKAITKNIEDTDSPKVYEKIVDAVNSDKGKTSMKKSTSSSQIENHIRSIVRKHINEEMVKSGKKPKMNGPIIGDLPPVKKIPYGVHGGEYNARLEKNKKDLQTTLKKGNFDISVSGEDEDDFGAESKPKGRKFNTMTDVSGTGFADIAKELGFSVAGAKQAVDKALLKSQWVAQMSLDNPDDLEIIVLSSMNDYIKMLAKTGELSPDDIKLMKSNPEIVRELDGFREFLDKALRKARKATRGDLENPLGESRSFVKGKLKVVLEKSSPKRK